jgi:arylsulfatase A-like enzyme
MKKIILILAGCCFLSCINAQLIKSNKIKRPNIIIILSDDHAYQAISAYGSKIAKTPQIDRLAKQGAIFNKAYVTNSICGPSRAVILTGRYSHQNGFKDNDHSVFDGSQNTFVKELQRAGYQTAWIGKWHLTSLPQGFNFWQVLPGQGDYYNPDFIMMDGRQQHFEGYVSNLVEDFSEDWLNNRDSTKPFCLVIGHKAVHRTWLPDMVDLGKYDKVKFPLPANFYDDYKNRDAAAVQDMTIAKTMLMGYDLKMKMDEKDKPTFERLTEAQRAIIAPYYQKIEDDLRAKNLSGNALTEWKFQRYLKDYLNTANSIDRNVGRTLDYLDEHQLAGNTIVIYMSDQGFYLGEHGWFDKRWMYEESFSTPMLMRYPGIVKPGSTINQMVMNLDIAPTMLAAAGVPVPKEMQGQSMLPIIKNNKAKWRNQLYYHYYENTVHSVSPHFGVKGIRYKLIRFYERVNGWELYDLQQDPKEMKNLYGQKGYDKITEQLKKQLNQLIEQYNDTEAKEILAGEKDGTGIKK